MDTYFLLENLKILNEGVSKLATDEQCENNLDIWRKNTVSPVTVFLTINKLRRFGWHLKPEAIVILNEIRNNYRDIQRYHVHAWLQVKMSLNGNVPDWRLDEIRESVIRSVENFTMADHEYMSKEKAFNNLHTNIEDYFDIK